MNTIQTPENSTIELQLELNKTWIYLESAEDPVGEKNFVIPLKYFLYIFPKLFPAEHDIYHFLNVYTEVIGFITRYLELSAAFHTITAVINELDYHQAFAVKDNKIVLPQEAYL